MSAFEVIVLLVGTALLLLGGLSGFALFSRALKLSDRFGDETNVGTLWGLFLLGARVRSTKLREGSEDLPHERPGCAGVRGVEKRLVQALEADFMGIVRASF